jgi:hypothetical protein
VDLMTLPAVAEETHQAEDQLGRWCATGKLRCDRDGRSWLIPRTELSQVKRLGLSRGRSGTSRAVVGLAVPGSPGRAQLGDEVAAVLSVDSEEVDVRDLSIDGQSFVVVAWSSEPNREATARLEELASERGGELLEAGPTRSSIPVIPRTPEPVVLGSPNQTPSLDQRAAASTPPFGRSTPRPG